MKIQTSRQFFARLAARRLARILSVAAIGMSSLCFGQFARALTYTYAGGTTNTWNTTTAWTPNGVPDVGDTAVFSGSASQTVLLSANQSALDLSFVATAGTSAIRWSGTGGQTLSLGSGGIQFGSTQTDLGGGSAAQAIIMSLTGSQSWTGTNGGGLIQLDTAGLTAQQTFINTTQQAITNGTAGAVTLTFDGVSTGGKTIGGAIDNGVLGGTLALALNTTGTFGSLTLNGVNTFSGGTTFTQGFLNLQNNSALGTGPLTFVTGTQTKSISSGLIGGITLTNNNAINLNGTITLGGGQNIDFGTGATTLGSATILSFNSTTNPVNYTLGGAITGAFALTIQGNSNTIAPAILNLNGVNTGNSPANPITLNSNAPTVRFGPGALPTGAGSVVLNGGAIAVGPGTAFAGATPIATFLADTRVTKTSGSIALTGDNNESFTAPNTNITLGAALGSVARYTGTLTPSGTNYNVGGGGGTIVFTGANAFTGTRTLSTNNGSNGSNGNSNFGAGGTTIITGQNTFDGAVSIGAGTLEVSSINKVTGGTATSNLGAPTTAANGQINIGYSGQAFSELRYTGLGETTDRTLNFNGFSGATIGLDASGSGALTLGGTFAQANTSNNRFVSLRGINTGANTITGNLGTGTVASAGGFNLTKVQRGNWTLSGVNNLAATNNVITINGGTLTADFSTNSTAILSAAANATGLTLGGGTLAMVNNTAATTATQTLGTTILTANTGQSNVSVTGNGTAGSAVLTQGATYTRNANAFLNFNLLNGGQVATATTATNFGVLVGSGTVAAFTVTDAAGADFATVTGGQIAKLGATTPLPTSGATISNNYVLTGSQTQTAQSGINTLRIAPTASGGTLALGALNGFSAGLNAVSILKDGAFDYTITGTATLANTAVVLSSFGTGALNINVPVATGSNTLTKTGPGLVTLGVAQTYTGTTSIYGGVLRTNAALSASSNIILNTGGILELGNANFTGTVGTGGGQVQWGNGDGGFSAFGGNRIVALTNNLGVATGQLVWGSTSGNNNVAVPNASPLFVRDGQALLLSSSTATGTLDFQNPLDFVNMARAVVVGDGTATVDAILSGVLSSSDYSGGLEKSGAGTLAVTGANTYTGETRILAGTLQVGNGGTTGTLGNGGNVVNNAALVFNRTDAAPSVGNLISGTGTLTQAGTGTTTLTANNTYSGATLINAGTLLVNNTPVGGVGSGTGIGAVTVTGTGTLGGTGILGGTTGATGAVTVNTGGFLAPGDPNVAGGIGTLTIGSATVNRNTLLAGGSTFSIQVGAGTSDRLVMFGNFDLTGTQTLALSGTFDGTTNYVIATFTGLVGTFENVTGLPANYSVTYNPGNITLIAAVPEPGTWAMLAVGVGALACWQRRRSRQDRTAV